MHWLRLINNKYRDWNYRCYNSYAGCKQNIYNSGMLDVNKFQWFLLFGGAEFHPVILGDMDEIKYGGVT